MTDREKEAADEIERLRAIIKATQHRDMGPGFTHHDGPDCPCFKDPPA